MRNFRVVDRESCYLLPAPLPEGRRNYALRKQTPEPVFETIKLSMLFRQFFLCGLENVKGEWNMVALAWNMKRMFAHAHT